ncbi:type 1 fimbrial protein [Dyella jejuensis]|uniref:Type 1 fimbrial protein n=1 Tax=Dyella jejuensis TaxID=1432009 RepID=A0ABW8JK33_9GAMM
MSPSGDKLASFVLNGNIDVAPSTPTCSAASPAAVNIGTVPASQFGGVGQPSTTSQNFNITLTCTGGQAGLTTNVFATLTDQANPANVSDTLPLTPGGATGVGIQVLHNGTVLKFGPDSSAAGNTNQWNAGTTGNGQFVIPLTARYVQTAPTITSGAANSVATFTMSYQ